MVQLRGGRTRAARRNCSCRRRRSSRPPHRPHCPAASGRAGPARPDPHHHLQSHHREYTASPEQQYFAETRACSEVRVLLVFATWSCFLTCVGRGRTGAADPAGVGVRRETRHRRVRRHRGVRRGRRRTRLGKGRRVDVKQDWIQRTPVQSKPGYKHDRMFLEKYQKGSRTTLHRFLPFHSQNFCCRKPTKRSSNEETNTDVKIGHTWKEK